MRQSQERKQRQDQREYERKLQLDREEMELRKRERELAEQEARLRERQQSPPKVEEDFEFAPKPKVPVVKSHPPPVVNMPANPQIKKPTGEVLYTPQMPRINPVKSKPVEKPKHIDPVDNRQLEMVVRINMKEKGVQHINVFEGDEPDDLARQFCQQHKIRDREKQYKLLKSLEYQIDQHRNP